ncbi:hypothetical protein GRI75_03360 [Altererythrobacter soli]|uniref:TonB-dependent receptor n=1 Tax=Croceibacterium soli TaxID=1739690 RepID=A0A6I4UT36_9SPHN|nr:hypothetical protein [Croceibacterium soli]MXP40687.1 hypothetical protein [Croceibacterium soli]
MYSRLLAGAAALALFPAAAPAQDHSGHAEPAPPAAAQPAAEPQSDHSAMNHGAAEQPQPDHSAMDHSAMEQPQVDHGAMGHPQKDHSQMNHSQMDHSTMPMARGDHSAHVSDMSGEGSGTSRLPPNETMNHGAMIGLGGDDTLMLHGFLWPVYTNQGGPRGDDKLYVQSMAMATMTAPFEGGKFTLRTMMSLEPLLRHDGYPSLFATGEVAYGEPLVDRQHPHDLFMELAGRLDVDIAEDTSVFLYGGPVGEPALGPSAFMHRASARYNPEAPITHHWFDSTHIVYGVLTGGVAGPRWQLEASTFRGREPDEFRWNIEEPKFDSWSVRASFAPARSWLLQASYGEIDEPEEMHPGQDEHRTTASAHYNNGHGLSAMAAYSGKNRQPGDTLDAWLGEVNWDLTDRHTVFGRVENVENDELFPDHHDPLHDQAFRVTKFQAGYAYRIPLGPLDLALGGTVSAFAKPDALDEAYGSSPIGYTLFARFSLGD